MSHYSNPTENAAISAVDRELKAMRRRAGQIKTLHQQHRLTDKELAEARKQFTGIYKRLLREALERDQRGPKKRNTVIADDKLP